MTEGQFVDAVLEALFSEGLNCPNLPLLTMYTRMESQRLGTWPDPGSFAAWCVQQPGVTYQPESPTGDEPSTTAGARDRWLAVHEAGHAIVGIEAGFTLRGIRFYGADGFPGEAGFEDHAWETSRDEGLLRQLIRVDVAGNMAEIVHPDCSAPQGRLSDLYADRTSGDRPTDFISADARARHLAVILLEGAGKPLDKEEIWISRRAIVEQAESEAEQVLQQRVETLSRLADQLQRGPMTGTAVRLLMGR